MPMKYRQVANAANAKAPKKSAMQPSKYPPKKKMAAKAKKGY